MQESNTESYESPIVEFNDPLNVVEIFEDRDEPELIKLKDTKHKNLFLAKVGLCFILHFTVWVLTAIFITNYNHFARDLYMLFRLEFTFWFFALYFITIRLVFGFASDNIGKLTKFFLVLDLFITFVFVLGLFFYFNEFLLTQYIWQGHYIIMTAYIFWLNMVIFTFSTLIKNKKKGYDYTKGLFLMEVASFITVFGVLYVFDIPTITLTKQKIYFVLISLFNLFFCVNAFYLLRHRGDKFYDNQYIHAYFCFWTDWCYYFWFDLTYTYRKSLSEEYKRAKEEKKQRQKEIRAKRAERERRRQEESDEEESSEYDSDTEGDEKESVNLSGDVALDDKGSNNRRDVVVNTGE